MKKDIYKKYEDKVLIDNILSYRGRKKQDYES